MILVVSAFHWAPAAVIAPFQYTQMIWGVLFGYLVWGDVPEPVLFVGGGIVVASGLYILHRETLRPVPPVAPAAATPGPPPTASRRTAPSLRDTSRTPMF